MTLQRDLLSGPPVDLTLLADLREEMGGPGSPLFLEAITSYVEESRLHLDALEKAAAERQEEPLRREAHILKGSSGYFGARRVQAICRQIETLAETNQWPDIRRSIADLRAEFRRACETLTLEASHGPA